MAARLLGWNARDTLRAVVAAGFLLMLGANLPGHMSYDSAAQLHEGYLGVRQTWGPPVYAWLLAFFDGVVPGTALYVVASGLLLSLSLVGLADLGERPSWLGVAVAALLLVTPQVLIYQAVVWKDVMCANAAVAGGVCLAQAAHRWSDAPRRWGFLAAAAVLLALASLVRQNGVVVVVLLAVALGWIASAGGWRRGLAWGVGGLVAVLIVAQTISGATRLQDPGGESSISQGLQIVQTYDLVGAAAMDPDYPLDVLARARPDAVEVIRRRSPAVYSGDRVDWITRDRELSAALTSVHPDLIARQWRELVLTEPLLYARVRLEDFRWVFMTPDVDRCMPVYVGIDAPLSKLDPVGLQTRRTPADSELANYASWYLDTPVFSHVAFAVAALLTAGVLLLRRRPADIAVAGLLLGGLAFTASFLIVSIACDYRYLYLQDLTAMVGLVYLALHPPSLGSRRRRAGA